MSKLTRVATYSIDEVLPYIFTGPIRRKLIQKGYSYTSDEWIAKSKRTYKTPEGDAIDVTMGSHRYQMFAQKGIVCIFCGLEGKFFALEKQEGSNKYHFNLYGIDDNGNEMMLTKDHIIPRSKGGKNVLGNYQPLCAKCNVSKANKILC